jgi:hypothetical protein
MNEWWSLFDLQARIAERWRDRGDQTRDPFARFFFYFAAFNALYFLWKCIDQKETSVEKERNEGKQIANLLSKFSESEAADILGTIDANVTYFLKRQAIRRMDTKPGFGDPQEGRKWQRKLREGSSSINQLNALGQIIYIARSNLAHGSKADSGDDEEIIRQSLPPLKILVERSLKKAHEEFAFA